jgi:hypothetical protein
MRKYRAMALSAVVLGVLLGAGCGPNTTNEENFDKTKPVGGPGRETTYAEFAKKQQEQAAQIQKEAKGAKGKGKPAPAAQPKPESEQPKPEQKPE